MSGANVNDRLALELGRAILRAVVAEEQRDQAVTALRAVESPPRDEAGAHEEAP